MNDKNRNRHLALWYFPVNSKLISVEVADGIHSGGGSDHTPKEQPDQNELESNTSKQECQLVQ